MGSQVLCLGLPFPTGFDHGDILSKDQLSLRHHFTRLGVFYHGIFKMDSCNFYPALVSYNLEDLSIATSHSINMDQNERFCQNLLGNSMVRE